MAFLFFGSPTQHKKRPAEDVKGVSLDTALRPHIIEVREPIPQFLLTGYEKIEGTNFSNPLSGLIISEGYPDWAGGLILNKSA
jgi:hypothetical protein